MRHRVGDMRHRVPSSTVASTYLILGETYRHTTLGIGCTSLTESRCPVLLKSHIKALPAPVVFQLGIAHSLQHRKHSVATKVVEDQDFIHGWLPTHLGALNRTPVLDT